AALARRTSGRDQRRERDAPPSQTSSQRRGEASRSAHRPGAEWRHSRRNRHMATKITMPQLGESVAEGTVGRWLKQEGDTVKRDESLVEIITDKVTAELPSPVSGRLIKILVAEDQTVKVGVDIAEIEETGGASATSSQSGAQADAAAPASSASSATSA